MRLLISLIIIFLAGCVDQPAEYFTQPSPNTNMYSDVNKSNIIDLFAEPLMEILEEKEEYSDDEGQYYDQEYDYSEEEYEYCYDEYEWETYEEEYDEPEEDSGEDYGPWTESNPYEWGGVYDPETGLIDYGGGKYGATDMTGWMTLFGKTEEEFEHLHDGE